MLIFCVYSIKNLRKTVTKMTIYDISEKAGVSIATVSRVINGNDNVSKKTRQKVLSIIEEVGFTPNVFARGLGLDTINSVGILCSDCSDMFFAKTIYLMETRLRQAGYESILVSSGFDLKGRKEGMETLLSKRVDSIITLGSSFIFDNDEDNEYLRNAADQVPVMMLNGDYDYKNVYCIYCDDYAATSEMVSFLLDSGSKKILYIYDSPSLSSKKKINGLQTALLTKDMVVDKDYIIHYDGPRDNPKAVADFIKSHYDQGKRFDTIACSTDMLGVGAIKFAANNGLKVPDDLVITGNNNSAFAICCNPELTTIDNHVEQMCSTLIDSMLDILGGKKKIPQKIVIPCDIIKRGSTK